MNGNRRWLGWLAIGLGALALLVTLTGRSFGLQMMAGVGGSTMPQAYAQQRTAPQSGAVPPGANAQQGAGHASADKQRGPAAPGAVARQGGGRPGNAGFGVRGLFGFPFKLFGGVTRLGLLALLVVLGVWLIRGRQPSDTASTRAAGPAQGPAPEQRSPSGESYADESDTDEPRDQACQMEDRRDDHDDHGNDCQILQHFECAKAPKPSTFTAPTCLGGLRYSLCHRQCQA